MKPGTGLAILLLASLAEFSEAAEHYKVCTGTSQGYSSGFEVDNQYQNLRDRYINCTHVDGNLEIVRIDRDPSDFLKDIREVTGYVFMYKVDTLRLVLPNLTIIRGRGMRYIWTEKYALYVERGNMETFELPALREISSGGVYFGYNPNLCYVNTINWEEIMDDKSASIEIKQSNDTCPPCHETCEHGCWGPGPNNCQTFSKMNCSSQCHQRRCFGPSPLKCCHRECAGGCSGPTQYDCLFCKNFDDDGVCRESCPSLRRYNSTTGFWEVNPDGKYAYGYRCAKSCPEHLLRDDGGCVRFCPEGKKDVDGECVSCDGPCPKRCKGVEYVHARNIHTFKGCTILEGSLTINITSFSGDVDGIHPDELEVFSTLKEVTGFLRIEGADHPDFKHLSYFRNLEIVDGRELTVRDRAALSIKDTSLRSLNLRSLRKVRFGDVVISKNFYLCFADEIEWRRLMTSSTGTVWMEKNAYRLICELRGSVCHEQCSSDGCWGSRPDDCLTCKSYKLKETCVPSCNASHGVYDAGNNTCESCDGECLAGCSGPGPSNCTQCRHARDGPYCVSNCPVSKYNEYGECKPCHESCATGCTGPGNAIGPGGCNSCYKAIVSTHDPDIPACKYFDENGFCKQECPSLRRYNPATYSWEINPDGRYAYGHICVKKCPEPFLRDNDACVRTCPETKKNVDGECVSCGGPCPKTCQGVEIVHAGNIQTFKGCTIIEGFLKIVDYTFSGFIASNNDTDPVFPEMHPDELEVFSTLKEVTGFVSIRGAKHPDFRNLSYFRNLEIVHGRQIDRTLWIPNAALLISLTSLRSLNLRSLREVRSHHVVIQGNPDLCFAEEIDWRRLMTSELRSVEENGDREDCRRRGLVCDEQCSSHGCWGSGPDECLSCKSFKLNKTCVPSCNATRGVYDAGSNTCGLCDEECLLECSGPGPSNCTECRHVRDGPYCVSECPVGKYNEGGECKPCHESYVSGCTGPRNVVGPGGCNSCNKANVSAHDRNIAACKYFDENGVCKPDCPPLRKYNPSTYSWEINPDGRYSYGHLCVKKCPEPFVGESGACVRSCPETKKNVDGECVACNGLCAKTCKGVEIVHAGNIATFNGCTIIEGSLKIVDYTFSGFVASNNDTDRVFPEMHPDELEVFSTLKELTGFLHIEAYHPDFKSLSYFRNLEIVGGRELTGDFILDGLSLYIMETSLRSLSLRSLREIQSGDVKIEWNPDLCFVQGIDWERLMISEIKAAFVFGNAWRKDCSSLGEVCDEQCSTDGCWALGPDECLSCKFYRLKETCVPGCDATSGVYDAGSNTCEFCDEECLLECTGPGPSSCTQCRHARDGLYCVSECPKWKYNESGECKPCSEICTNGCTGPRDTVGPGGCNSRDEAIRSEHDLDITVQCLKADEPCPVGYYEGNPREGDVMKSLTQSTRISRYKGKHENVSKSSSLYTVCRKCPPRCKNCTAYDILTPVCHCANYTDGEKCLDACPRSHYPDNSGLQCVRCDGECRGCHGPSSTECDDCRNFRVYLSSDRKTFNCTASCPADKPHIHDDSKGSRYCSDANPALAKSGNPEVLSIFSTSFVMKNVYGIDGAKVINVDDVSTFGERPNIILYVSCKM